jgi:hypothetical protein
MDYQERSEGTPFEPLRGLTASWTEGFRGSCHPLQANVGTVFKVTFQILNSLTIHTIYLIWRYLTSLLETALLNRVQINPGECRDIVLN